MKLHTYKVRDGYLVETEDYRLLGEVDGMRGFVENSDWALVFGTIEEARLAGGLWDPEIQ